MTARTIGLVAAALVLGVDGWCGCHVSAVHGATGGRGGGGAGTGGLASGGSDASVPPCDEGGTFASPDAGTIPLPQACALPPQGCNPIDATGCDVASGATCDLARDGTFACASTTVGGTDAGGMDAGVGLGQPCSGSSGPFCGPSMTCVAGACASFCCADSDCPGSSACAPLRAMRASGGNVGTCVPAGLDAGQPDASTDAGGAADAGAGAMVGNHPGVFEGRGFLVPWTSWADALAREMSWYATKCGQVSGYPIFATAVHLDGNCQVSVDDAIPAMQDGTGILSYLKYYDLGGRSDPAMLAVARSLGDYLAHEALTPDSGAYPAFPRSTGLARAVPQPPDCGSQDDMPYEIEPDKGGIAGHALMQLSVATGDATYANVALRIAQTLVANMGAGDGASTPWPFRADWRTGTPRGTVSSNLSYILRLFDELAPTHPELAKPRAALWSYIKDYQLPDIYCGGNLWAQFFEDGEFNLNRNAWAPLSLAAYMIEQQEALDPDWKTDARDLLGFVNANFVDKVDGFPVCIEQDFDREPFGGILSTYGAVNAMYAKAVGTATERLHAYQVLTILVYGINDDGCPVDLALSTGRGGWQEDAHLDKVHNFADALVSFPTWAN